MVIKAIIIIWKLCALKADDENFVLRADDIEKVKTDLLAKQLEDGFVFQEIITHNKEIVRIALMGGDISKILFGGGGKLRENRIGSCKIAICRNKANDLHIVLKKKMQSGLFKHV